ncbi:MAG: DUF882 domain-containing protein [gamma proteobacterium symbiont of Taylorina sp.]|nr:DUF882 domain-containing protein [gamma proteobacterium symbiont of Taylorina sp.]
MKTNNPIQLSRRLFIAGTLSLPFSANSLAKNISVDRKRSLSFYHTHTDKTLTIIYFDGKSYLPTALDEINLFLSDFRTGDIHPIETRLLDAVYLLQQQTGVEDKFEVISAYRSPKTNQQLRKSTTGVAKKSLHMQGKAIDIRLRGFNTSKLRDTAIAMKLGGVGYYRRSNFIHLDTGRVREW